jgi:hypothetical protein
MNATKDARDQKVLFQTPTDIGARVATTRALSYPKKENVHDLLQEGAIHAHLHGTPLSIPPYDYVLYSIRKSSYILSIRGTIRTAVRIVYNTYVLVVIA